MPGRRLRPIRSSLRGTVTAVHERHVAVVVTPSGACERCASGKGCGAGLWTRARTLMLPHETAGEPLVVGRAVAVACDPGHVLRTSLLAFGLPLTGIVAGALAAVLCGGGDAWVALGATAGFGAGALGSRHAQGLAGAAHWRVQADG